jgi:tRNA(fMet)-specific endonuclease VapC
MTASYLIDTDWVIDHFSGVAAVSARLRELAPKGLALSVISIAELWEGVHFSRNPTQSRALLKEFLSGVMILGVDEQTCEHFGRPRGSLRRQGTPIADFDLLSRRLPFGTISRFSQTIESTLRGSPVSRSKAPREFVRPPCEAVQRRQRTAVALRSALGRERRQLRCRQEFLHSSSFSRGRRFRISVFFSPLQGERVDRSRRFLRPGRAG